MIEDPGCDLASLGLSGAPATPYDEVTRAVVEEVIAVAPAIWIARDRDHGGMPWRKVRTPQGAVVGNAHRPGFDSGRESATENRPPRSGDFGFAGVATSR